MVHLRSRCFSFALPRGEERLEGRAASRHSTDKSPSLPLRALRPLGVSQRTRFSRGKRLRGTRGPDTERGRALRPAEVDRARCRRFGRGRDLRGLRGRAQHSPASCPYGPGSSPLTLHFQAILITLLLLFNWGSLFPPPLIRLAFVLSR